MFGAVGVLFEFLIKSIELNISNNNSIGFDCCYVGDSLSDELMKVNSGTCNAFIRPVTAESVTGIDF